MDNAAMNQLVDVVAEHAYTAVEEDELSLRPGDVLRSVERRPGGWWKGELRGRTGLFPDNFVRIIKTSYDNTNDATRNSAPRYCRAQFSYQQANPDELSLAVGDIIQVLGEEEEGWWRGQRGSLRGVFPSNFVVSLDPTPVPPPTLPPKPVREQCRVLFPYTAANADELTLAEGDTVTIVTRDVPDQGWWRGELRGRIGLFPDNFVTVLPSTVLPGTVSPGDTNTKKPGRPSKNLSSNHQNKSQPVSMNRKDSTSSRSSIGSGGHDNVASVRKSLEVTDGNSNDVQKAKKSLDASDTASDTNKRRLLEPDSDHKPRRSLEVDGGIKPPVPAKKATSPVAAMFSGLKHRLTGQNMGDSTDGATHSRGGGEPVLVAASSSPPPAPCSPLPPLDAPSDGFDQIERSSMLNDPRAGRVKAPRRRPPSQALRDDLPLTNGSTPHPVTAETALENEVVKPKAREWEKHKAPWMDELKLNQAKKTSPIAELGRSKTIATTDCSDKTEPPQRLSGSTDKILESNADTDKDSLNPLEMSQSMTAISTKTIQIDTSEEVHAQVENPPDLSKSMSSIASRASHHETNTKTSANELRTSISSSASVVLRLTTAPTSPQPVPVLRPLSSTSPYSPLTPVSRHSTTAVSDQSSLPIIKTAVNDMNSASPRNEKEISNFIKTNDDTLHSNETPEQLLIAQLNERVANLEKLVEAQEERFRTSIMALQVKLAREVELRAGMQAELLKLERCVTRV